MRVLSAADVDAALDWEAVVDHLEACHRAGPAQVGDVFLGEAGDTLLTRAAWLPERAGYGVKVVSVCPGNAQKGLPSVQGVVIAFDPTDGTPQAVIDGAAVTRWKTAGDSLCGARRLMRSGAQRLLVVGAGVIASTLLDGYLTLFPDIAEVRVWNRTAAKAEPLVHQARGRGVKAALADDLDAALGWADVVTSATMAKEPILKGTAVSDGTHVDLIGAFKPDMREADDTLLRRAALFVDTRDTTFHDIGELRIPLEAGVITEDDVRGDLYAIARGEAGRREEAEITLFKNGGGAHLDMMIAALVLSRVR